MVSEATVKLLAEVMGFFGEEDEQKAKEDPEACIYSMLALIKRELPQVSATLRMSIELTTHNRHLDEARKKIEQGKL